MASVHRFEINKVKDEITDDLNKKLVQSPALAPYIVAQIAGMASIKVAVPGILSGSVHGFASSGNTIRSRKQDPAGQARRTGLKARFINQKGGFLSRLWYPLFNIFAVGSPSRGIKPLPQLWESFDAQFQASGIADQVIEKALDGYDKNNIPDLQKYLLLGIRQRKKR